MTVSRLSHLTANRRRLVAVGAAAVIALPVLQAVQSAQAANPGSGTVRPSDPSAAWQGQNYPAAATADPNACPPKSEDPTDALCDHYTLNVPVTASYWDSRSGGAEVSISWPDAANDFDMYIYKGGDLVASSAVGGTTSEKALISKAVGTYEVRVLPFLVADSAYEGDVSFKTGPDDGAPPLGGPAEYHGTVFDDDVPCPSPPCLPNQEPQNQRIETPAKSLVLKSGPVGRQAAEPTLVVDKQGRAFYAAATFDAAGGLLADTRLLRSRNDGQTWPDITPAANLPITLDPYVYLEEDSNRLFDIDLYVADAFLNFSDDGGKTFTTNAIAGGGLDNVVQDHHTLFAGPVPMGSPLITLDPDFEEILYYCYNKVADVQCTRSLDGGVSFSGAGMTPPYPGAEPMEGGAFCGGLHGHLGSDREGRLFLPKGHCGRPYLARSTDAGTTWTRDRVSDRIDMPDDHSAVATDAFGTVYYVWYDSEHGLPWLAISNDHGQTFGDPIMIAPPGVREIQFPTVAAGEKGRVAISFVGTTEKNSGDLTRPWDHYVVASVNALAATPNFSSNISNQATDPVHRGDCPGRCGNMLDFLDVIVSPASDHSIWATVVDTCTGRRDCKTDDSAEGFDEATSDDNDAVGMRGIYVKQIAGPNIGW